MTSRLPRYGQAFLLPSGSIAPVWYDYLRSLDVSSLTAEIERQVQANTEAIKALEKAGFGDYLPDSAYVLGVNSVETFGELKDGTRVMLRGDVELPDPTTYYGANQDQKRGFHPVSGAIEAEAGELTKDVGADGVTTFGLADVAPDPGGTLQRYGFDAKGRRVEEEGATTDDLTEGAENLYFTDERVDARVQSEDYAPEGLWDFEHNITVAGLSVGLGPGEHFSNLAIGASALASRTTALRSTAIGAGALQSNQTGNNNTAIGSLSLNSLVSGQQNTVIGVQAAQNCTSAAASIVIGEFAAREAVSLNNSVIVGRGAALLGPGNWSVAVGNQSLADLTSGAGNTALGHQAGLSQTSGAGNTYMGFRAGQTATGGNANLTGQRNVFIGYDCGPGSPTQVSNSVAIGADAKVTSSDTVVLGRVTDNTVLGATGDDGSGAKLQVTGAIKSTSEYRVGGNKVVGERDTGWTDTSGTAAKGGGSTYAAPTISDPPTQSEVQAMANALQDAHQKIKALQDALTTHGLIGS